MHYKIYSTPYYTYKRVFLPRWELRNGYPLEEEIITIVDSQLQKADQTVSNTGVITDLTQMINQTQTKV